MNMTHTGITISDEHLEKLMKLTSKVKLSKSKTIRYALLTFFNEKPPQEKADGLMKKQESIKDKPKRSLSLTVTAAEDDRYWDARFEYRKSLSLLAAEAIEYLEKKLL